jgi:REP element-mobilizing transposase RayT
MLPRQIIPGTTYFVTRRCAFRQFLLKPDFQVNRIFNYCLAYAAKKTGIQLHAFIVMSNHWHGIATDPEGRLPEFMEILHKLVAKCINGHLGRSENVWSVERYSAIPLPSIDEVVDKIAYVLANPVSAFLVKRPEQWPGLLTTVQQLDGHVQQVKRPETFFRAKGNMPEVLELEIVPPPAAREVSPEEFRSKVRVRLEERIFQASERLREKKGRILGCKGILSQSPMSSPTSSEWFRKLKPKYTGKTIWRRLEALHRLRSFLEAYRSAWKNYCEGVKDVVFPAGTYWMKKHLGVLCAQPG